MRWRTACAAGALLAIGCGDAGYESGEERLGETEQAAEVCAEGEVLEGIDVSYYQSQPDWSAVAGSGLHFAITRVNHGSFMDPEFDTNWAAIKSVGLVRGAYQYFDPGGDPVAQANIFIDKVGMLGPGDLPGVIDVESTDGQPPATIAANVSTWVELVEKGTGRKPIIYTGSYFWNDNVKTAELADHPLWIAHYTQNCPNLPTAWSNWAIWQYSSTGKITGISGNVDTNRFNGSALALQDLAANGYRASVVSIDYPSKMAAGQSATVELVLKNEGARSWDPSTKLGTTEPRDRVSEFAAASWDGDNRPVAVVESVANGETVTLNFDIVAPAETGAYTEHFNLVQEGVGWFSDTPPGGGPSDDTIALEITVGPSTSSSSGDGGSIGNGGAGGQDEHHGGIPATDASASCAARPLPGLRGADSWWLVGLLFAFGRCRRVWSGS